MKQGHRKQFRIFSLSRGGKAVSNTVVTADVTYNKFLENDGVFDKWSNLEFDFNADEETKTVCEVLNSEDCVLFVPTSFDVTFESAYNLNFEDEFLLASRDLSKCLLSTVRASRLKVGTGFWEVNGASKVFIDWEAEFGESRNEVQKELAEFISAALKDSPIINLNEEYQKDKALAKSLREQLEEVEYEDRGVCLATDEGHLLYTSYEEMDIPPQLMDLYGVKKLSDWSLDYIKSVNADKFRVTSGICKDTVDALIDICKDTCSGGITFDTTIRDLLSFDVLEGDKKFAARLTEKTAGAVLSKQFRDKAKAYVVDEDMELVNAPVVTFGKVMLLEGMEDEIDGIPFFTHNILTSECMFSRESFFGTEGIDWCYHGTEGDTVFIYNGPFTEGDECDEDSYNEFLEDMADGRTKTYSWTAISLANIEGKTADEWYELLNTADREGNEEEAMRIEEVLNKHVIEALKR